jgi:hypothetical protein
MCHFAAFLGVVLWGAFAIFLSRSSKAASSSSQSISRAASMRHSKGQYGYGPIHTNTIEGYFSILRRHERHLSALQRAPFASLSQAFERTFSKIMPPKKPESHKSEKKKPRRE